jgi:tetratricopeptide (TPR) repeat protein
LQTSRPFDPTLAITRFPADFLQAVRWGFFPYPVSLYEPVATHFFDIRWWSGLSLIILLTAAAIKYIRKIPPILFLLLTFAITITPSIISNQYTHMFSPRYLFIPSTAIAAAAGLLFIKISRPIQYWLWTVPVILLLLAVIRISSWSSPLSLWTPQLEKHPDDILALINYGAAQRDKNNFGIADQAASKGIMLAKKQHHNEYLSMLYHQKGELLANVYGNKTAALKYYQKSVMLNSSSSLWMDIGKIHAYDGHYELALQAFLLAEKRNSDNFNICLSIAGAYGGMHRFDKAIEYIDKAINLARHAPKARAQAVRSKKTLLMFQKRYQSETPQVSR